MRRGFTLIELIMVIVILGILGGIAIPKYVDMKKDAKEAAAKAYIGTAKSQLSILWSQYTLQGDATVLPLNARDVDHLLLSAGTDLPDGMDTTRSIWYWFMDSAPGSGYEMYWRFYRASTGTGVPPRIVRVR